MLYFVRSTWPLIWYLNVAINPYNIRRECTAVLATNLDGNACPIGKVFCKDLLLLVWFVYINTWRVQVRSSYFCDIFFSFARSYISFIYIIIWYCVKMDKFMICARILYMKSHKRFTLHVSNVYTTRGINTVC